MINAIIHDLEILREHYMKNGQTEAAQGVQSAIAAVEDYRVDRGDTVGNGKRSRSDEMDRDMLEHPEWFIEGGKFE